MGQFFSAHEKKKDKQSYEITRLMDHISINECLEGSILKRTLLREPCMCLPLKLSNIEINVNMILFEIQKSIELHAIGYKEECNMAIQNAYDDKLFLWDKKNHFTESDILSVVYNGIHIMEVRFSTHQNQQNQNDAPRYIYEIQRTLK